MLAMVPVSSCKEVGLRSIISKQEYDKALEYFNNDEYADENLIGISVIATILKS